MRLTDKEISNEIGNYDYLRLLPSKDAMYLSGVLVIKNGDKYCLVKNRWSSYEKGDLYIDNAEYNNIHINELEYVVYKREDVLNVINGNCNLRDKFINCKYILFEIK